MSNPDNVGNDLDGEESWLLRKVATIPTKGCMFPAVSFLVLLAFAFVFIVFYPHDTDGDGVADKIDDCVNTAGVELVAVGPDQFQGCPDPDPDKDGFYVTIPGGLRGGVIATAIDECPDVRGTDVALRGCPSPTPEEVAVRQWQYLEKNCTAELSTACEGAVAKLAALPDVERTPARKAKAAEAEQISTAYEIRYPDSARAQDIVGVEAKLAKVKDEKMRDELRKDFDRKLWVSYYYDCSASNGICDGWYKSSVNGDEPPPMTRTEALQKISAFYDANKAYPKPEELVVELVENKYKLPEGMLAAKEWGVEEQDLKVAFGLDSKNFAFPGSCIGYRDPRFYGEAAKYGWLVNESIRCARENEQNWRFKDAISFARMAGQPAEAARIEQNLIEESLKRGEYSVTASGEPVIVIDNREEWMGS